MNPYPPDFCKKGKIAGKRPLIFSTPAAPGSKKPITPIPPQFTPIRSDDPANTPYYQPDINIQNTLNLLLDFIYALYLIN